MIPLATFRTLFDYNYWARDRQLDACAALTPEQFVRPLGGSFPSLRDTLAHLVAVEWLYLERFLGRPPTSLPPADEFPTTAVVRERWTGIERQLRDFAGGLSDEALARPFTYTNMKGQAKTYVLWQTLYHLTNPQTYHRGQVTSQLRQLGAAPPPVDFYVFLDTRNA